VKVAESGTVNKVNLGNDNNFGSTTGGIILDAVGLRTGFFFFLA
jgi:hypothetical protein